MSSEKKISQSVIRRLPRYYRYLKDLLDKDTERVSSRELSEMMHITASQVRQDFNCFGGFGQQGYGYSVKALYDEIEEILGVTDRFKLIIIGAGNIGTALSKHDNLKKSGFDIIAIFDHKESIFGKKINGIEIRDINKLEEYLTENKVDIAVLAVPYNQANELAKIVTELGIKAIWNFSPGDLHVPQDVVIENVHLVDSLMVLGYNLNENKKNVD